MVQKPLNAGCRRTGIRLEVPEPHEGRQDHALVRVLYSRLLQDGHDFRRLKLQSHETADRRLPDITILVGLDGPDEHGLRLVGQLDLSVHGNRLFVVANGAQGLGRLLACIRVLVLGQELKDLWKRLLSQASGLGQRPKRYPAGARFLQHSGHFGNPT